MKTIQDLVNEIRPNLESQIGLTGLSNISENISDPLVQILVNSLAGQLELERKLDEYIAGYDLRFVDCDRLEQLSGLLGKTKRINKKTLVQIAAFGANGALIPSGTLFNDQFGNQWTLTSGIQINNKTGFGVAESIVGNYSPIYKSLSLVNNIAGIEAVTNGDILEHGYITETCEQFRSRILNEGM